MADKGQAKYSALPFIDASGRDVFETGEDLKPDARDKIDFSSSDEIERISLNHKGSFNVFSDKYIDSSNIDFSGRIHPTHKSGYETKTIFEIIGEQVAKESPQQKYQRLQHELRELGEEVSQITGAMQSPESISALSLAKEVQELERQLHDLHLEKVLGPETIASGGSQVGTWTKQLNSQLQAFRSRPATKDEGSKDSVVYEMFYKPEHSMFAQTLKISDLESKLKEMEALIGSDSRKFDAIIADPDVNCSSLLEATASLHAKVALLDLSQIDHIAARLQGVLHCINEVSQKKEAVEHAEKQAKVSELHDIVAKWDKVADVVPDLVDRLKAIKSLNEQASSFSQSLELLTTTQSQIRDELRTQKDVLGKYEISFAENISSIQANCQALEGRIESLMKKVADA